MDYSKINKILNKFYFPNEIRSEIDLPKLWNIDTDQFNTWKRFGQNLMKSNIESPKVNCCVVKFVSQKLVKKSGKLAPRYSLFINDIDVTPFDKKRNITNWSQSGIRQFLQAASAFNIIYFDDRLGDYDKTFNISSEINGFFSEIIDWDSIIHKLFFRSWRTSIKHIKNFGFSLFICLLFHFDKNIFKKLDQRVFYKVKRKNKEPKFFLSTDDYCIKYLEKTSSEAYKNLINIFVEKYNNIENFIDSIYSNFFTDRNPIVQMSDSDIKYLRIQEAINKIEQDRKKIRQNILADRFSSGCLPNEYSDLCYADTNKIYLQPIGSLKAAHLYEVWKIKEETKDYLEKKYNNNNVDFSDEIKKYLHEMLIAVSHPKNGILIPAFIHDAFDKGEIAFNNQGKMIIQNDVTKKYVNNLVISPKVFNDEMKFFLNKR